MNNNKHKQTFNRPPATYQPVSENSGYGSHNISSLLGRFRLQRGILFGSLILMALLAFEVFNYTTTDFALSDLLGTISFVGIRWATILAIAFCGIDFAGIARLFTPEQGADEPAEVWYLFGAWMLAATMNAMLTWWGVSLAIVNHQSLGNTVVDRATMLRVVPIFVAVMVWLIRVLIIGTFSVAGERLFTTSKVRPRTVLRPSQRAKENPISKLPSSADIRRHRVENGEKVSTGNIPSAGVNGNK